MDIADWQNLTHVYPVSGLLALWTYGTVWLVLKIQKFVLENIKGKK